MEIEDFDDINSESIVDHEKSGVEVIVNHLLLKTLEKEGYKCGVEYEEDLFKNYVRREYNISESNAKHILTVYYYSQYNNRPSIEKTIEFEEYGIYIYKYY